MRDGRLQDVFFYALESAIKSYRRFAQARIDEQGLDITIDQWLVLRTLQDCPDATQQQVATTVFKDFASVTRILQLVEAKGYLRTRPHPRDGRRSALTLTAAGASMIRTLDPIVRANRRRALRGIAPGEAARVRNLLVVITANCTPEGP
jgi:DNA-binding MarR family transcriptional regulator